MNKTIALITASILAAGVLGIVSNTGSAYVAQTTGYCHFRRGPKHTSFYRAYRLWDYRPSRVPQRSNSSV